MLQKILLFFCCLGSIASLAQKNVSYSLGAIVRGDSTKKQLALVFTGDEFGEGLPAIIQTLKKQKVKGSFFFTGRFYRTTGFQKDIRQVNTDGHYLGPHSDEHLLYCNWKNRDSLLVTTDSFGNDIAKNMLAIEAAGFPVYKPHFFIPPFEWWNDSISAWSKHLDLTLFNFTPGIRTAVDYTWPELSSYKSSEWIMKHVKEIPVIKPQSLNGAIILIHAGTDPRRNDKLYTRLKELIVFLKQQGYSFKRIDELLKN